jgi:hypothetical protein
MSPPLNSNHTHLLQKVRGTKQYKCMHPDCSYLASREIVKGKRVLCPICRETYILEGPLLQLAKPHCKGCTKSPKQEKLNKLQSELDNVLEEIL